MAIIGTCGNCGGPVEVPDVWWGVYRPSPTCRNCGAVPEKTFGPTIKMKPPQWKCKYGQGKLEGKIRDGGSFTSTNAHYEPIEDWILATSDLCSDRRDREGLD